MAHALHKFKQLEKKADETKTNEVVSKPARAKKLELYNHIASKFENSDKDEKKRIAQERLRKRQEEKEAKLEAEKRKKEEEQENIRLRKLEEERQRKLREEEEERLRVQKEQELAEEEERKRLEKIKQQHEGKYAGLKPAAAMFEKALDAKRSVQKTVRGERVITLRKGTISEIRSKIFDSAPKEEPVSKQLKQGPKKHIIPDKKEDVTNKVAKPTEAEKSNVKQNEVLEPEANHKQNNDIENKERSSTDSSKKENLIKISEKENQDENQDEPIPDSKKQKRQSFISDFAALEKTYKILGLSKDPPKSDEIKPAVKKRHNSEGKVKNKDKVKVNRKSAVFSDEEPTEVKESTPKIEVKIDALDKGKASAKRNFFQDLINEKKGIVKKEPELLKPQLRKRGSLVSAFEQNPAEDKDAKRKSMIKEDVRVDAHRFNAFLNKFESKDQRAEAKAQMIKITKEQKEFERQKQLKEKQQRLAEIQEQENLRKEEEEMERKAALEEERRKDEEQRILKLEEQAELRRLELERIESKEASEKKKVIKKKKKPKKEEEVMNTEDAPKLALGVVDYNDVKSKFERKKHAEVTEITSPIKPLRINKLANNPFLENAKPEEKPMNREIKVNKLMKNSFIQQLEKRGSLTEEYDKPKPKPVIKKDETRQKKVSTESNIKFESKKEKKISQEETGNTDDNRGDRRLDVRVSKSIEGQNPKKKMSKNNKSGSTMSLQKIFIDGPKEFLRSSKEKLYKLSKETLCEFNEPLDVSNPTENKPTRNDMQNYLLSHVLFDGKDVIKKEKVNKKEEDDIEKYLDKEYKAKIDQYCSLLEEEKPQKKKKKKKTKDKKVEEKMPTMKMVEIKTIQQQLQQQKDKPTEKPPIKINDTMFGKNESNVNKFKEMFDNDNKVQHTVVERGQDSRRSKRVKSDIFTKIQALEKAEKERLEREKENEERIKMLLQMELERQQNCKIDIEGERSENEAEENLKHNILQCLEDEVQNLEQEMLALENEEQLIMEEEAEEMEEAAKFETSIDEDDTELAEHINQLQEIHGEIEERKKAAHKKKKVLERFQHVFDRDESEQKTGIKVGTIHDRLSNFLENKDTQNTKVFEDNVFVGVSDVMSKFKNKLETQEDETPALFSRSEIKRKPNPTALKFEMMHAEEDDVLLSPKTPVQNDWSWKKKTAEELHVDTVVTDISSNETEKKKSRNFQDTKFNELLADINAVKQRMNERDAKRQEKENEQRIREMEEAIKEVQDSLNSRELNQFSEDSDEDFVEVRSKQAIPAKAEKEVRSSITGNKIGELKSQLMTMIKDNDIQEKSDPKENIEVSVSQIKQKILNQEDSSEKINLKAEKQKKSVPSNTITQLAQKLEQEEREEEVQLRKAPKLLLKNEINENDYAPAKTLEELKAEKQKQKWTWKEKDVRELQDYISAYDDIAPNKIIDQQQVLKDLEEEQEVVESLTNNKDTDILVQIREEKEREFNKFMDGVKNYLTEDPKTVEEVEFKKGMEGYLALIDNDKSPPKSGKNQPKVKLNTVSKLKTSLFDNNELPSEKKTSPQVNRLNMDRLDITFTEKDSAKIDKPDLTVTSEKTQQVKKMFEQKEEKSPKISPPQQNNKTGRISIFERVKRKTMEDRKAKLEHQITYKQKTLTELHDYIEHNENLANERLMSSIRDFKIRKEEEKVKYHEVFIDHLTKFLSEQCKSDEQNIFRGNIRAYLTILDNVDSKYNATPKLRKHRGSINQSNIRKAILEKSCERPQINTKDQPKIDSLDEKLSVKSDDASSKILDPEEKKKEILKKYGLKDRTPIVIQAISDDSDDSSESEDEVDMKKLTDKELAEKYGLPYFEVREEKNIEKSDSTAGYTSLLSKIRQAQSDKSQSITQTKQKFEHEKASITPTTNKRTVTKSDSTARIKSMYESLSPTNSRSNSPLPIYEPGSIVTSRMKKRFEDKTPDRRSFISDGSNSRCNSPLSFTDEVVRSGSTSRMKQMFETESPSNSRSSSPLLRREPGSLLTSKMKKRFEDTNEAPRRLSLIPNDAASTVGSANKIKNIFENSTSCEQKTPLLRNKGLEKSTTISNIGSIFQHSITDTPNTKQKLAESFFNQERSSRAPTNVKSPTLSRAAPLEKCKSLSKIKNAFETGKGLNDDEEEIEKLETRKSIHAELELLRSTANPVGTPNNKRKSEANVDTEKTSLAASFFNKDRKEQHTSQSNSKDSKKENQLETERKRINEEIGVLKGLGNIQNMLKPSTSKSLANKSLGLQKSTTVSDIGSYLKHKFEESPKVSPKIIPMTQATKTKSTIFDSVADETFTKIPPLDKVKGVEKSKSFTKFKDAFEDGVGLMNESENYNIEKVRVNAELTALQSSSKIQKMFRINKSQSNSNNSPKFDHIDLDDDTKKDMQKSRSAITSMFEAQGPKITFGGTPKAEIKEPTKPKPIVKKEKEEDITGRKWVFDTIQKYFDVIVEEENEEVNSDQEDEEEEEGDYDDENESESDYTSAEDELPDIDIPTLTTRKNSTAKLPEINRTLPVRQVTASPEVRNKFSTLNRLNPMSRHSPSLSMPVQRASSLRASTVSPLTLPRFSTERKSSVISIESFVDDAARQFDQLTDGSGCSLNDHSSDEKSAEPMRKVSKIQSVSTQSMNKLSKSGSSSKIRGLFSSVVHGSGSSLNVSTFKSNLLAHLSNRGSGNLDPGVGDDSSSEYSEYD